MPIDSKKVKGFTLIELMMTLAIAAILVSLAVPSFTSIIQNSRMTTQYNELLTSLSLARSESIKRSVSITICKSNDQDATPSCGGNWHDGWLVFVDNDADGSFDSSDSDEVIRIHPALSGNNTLSNNSKNRITYAPTGLATGFNSTFTLCDIRGNSNRKGLVISASGRARKSNTSDTLEDC